MIQELGFLQDSPTPIYEENYLIIDDVNSSICTERTCHIDVFLFDIQVWREVSYIFMHHIPGIINHADNLIKTVGWVLYSSHDRYLIDHYNIIFGSIIDAYYLGLDIDSISIYFKCLYHKYFTLQPSNHHTYQNKNIFPQLVPGISLTSLVVNIFPIDLIHIIGWSNIMLNTVVILSTLPWIRGVLS